MARNIDDIQNDVISTLAGEGINVSGSKTSTRRKWTFVFAYCGWWLENLWDQFMADVVAYLKTRKPHRLEWYRDMTLRYQHGFNLLPDSDEYDNTGYNDAQIAASKVIKYAAVVQQMNVFGRISLRIKIATIAGGDLAPLSLAVINGLKAYFERVADAGVPIIISSLPADHIKQEWTIYYDPLLLDSNGNRLDGSASDVARAAIKGYMPNLPFNGLFVNTLHIDHVQKVPGIVIPELNVSQAKYGALPFSNINTEYLPDAGYLRFIDDSYLTITYKPHRAIQ